MINGPENLLTTPSVTWPLKYCCNHKIIYSPPCCIKQPTLNVFFLFYLFSQSHLLIKDAQGCVVRCRTCFKLINVCRATKTVVTPLFSKVITRGVPRLYFLLIFLRGFNVLYLWGTPYFRDIIFTHVYQWTSTYSTAELHLMAGNTTYYNL